MIRAALAMAALVVAAPAVAHPTIVKVTPGANSAGSAPSEIRILFSEAVMAPLSGIMIMSADGRHIATAKARVEQGGRELIVAVTGPMAKGGYQVHWHVVSSDTHRVEGKYAFTVK